MFHACTLILTVSAKVSDQTVRHESGGRIRSCSVACDVSAVQEGWFIQARAHEVPHAVVSFTLHKTKEGVGGEKKKRPDAVTWLKRAHSCITYRMKYVS